jgi:hypothetical protein
MPETMTQETELKTQALTFFERTKNIQIKTPGDFRDAGELQVLIKQRIKQVVEFCADSIELAHKAHKAALAQEKAMLEPYEQAKAILDPQIKAHLRNEEKKRFELEAQIREANRRQQEEERLRQAVALEQAGRKDEAEVALIQPIFTPPVILAKAVPKVEGMSSRKVWKFKISNEALLPREFLVPDTVKIGQVVRAMKGVTNIAGVEVFEDLAV